MVYISTSLTSLCRSSSEVVAWAASRRESNSGYLIPCKSSLALECTNWRTNPNGSVLLPRTKADRPGHAHTQPGARRPGRARAWRPSGVAEGLPADDVPVAVWELHAPRGGREAATGGGHRASGVILGAERTRTLSNRRGAAASENPTTTPQPWIEQVPHRVTEHVQTVDCNRQAKTRPQSQPWRRLHILTPFSAEHTSPARKVDWQTESEEA